MCSFLQSVYSLFVMNVSLRVCHFSCQLHTFLQSNRFFILYLRVNHFFTLLLGCQPLLLGQSSLSFQCLSCRLVQRPGQLLHVGQVTVNYPACTSELIVSTPPSFAGTLQAFHLPLCRSLEWCCLPLILPVPPSHLLVHFSPFPRRLLKPCWYFNILQVKKSSRDL